MILIQDYLRYRITLIEVAELGPAKTGPSIEEMRSAVAEYDTAHPEVAKKLEKLVSLDPAELHEMVSNGTLFVSLPLTEESLLPDDLVRWEDVVEADPSKPFRLGFE